MLHFSSSYYLVAPTGCHKFTLFLPYPLYLVNWDNQKFVVLRYIGSRGFVGMSMFNFKVHGLLAHTSGTTWSHPDPAQCVGPEFKGWYLEHLWRKETSPLREGKRTDEWTVPVQILAGWRQAEEVTTQWLSLWSRRPEPLWTLRGMIKHESRKGSE